VDVWSLIDDVGARRQVTLDVREQMRAIDLPSLLDTLLKAFSEDELKKLCFHFGFDYADLPGDGRVDKARELILWLERRGQLEELIEYARAHRPRHIWD
jgi:hypothetical protein